MRKVEVKPYSEQWVSAFHEEANRINAIFGSAVIRIHHIGSTAVPGLQAKPTIDIMPVVKDITRIDHYNKAMVAIGYEPRGENGITGRRYFQKGGENRTHHVHVYQEGSKEIVRHLAFRDYLRANPKIARGYGDLKEDLAKRYPFDIESYINGKNELVLEIEEKALSWYKTMGEI